jgi:hypothetical protein
MAAESHLAEYALTLHLLLQHLEGLVDIVVSDENLHAAFLLGRAINGSCGPRARAAGTRICTISSADDTQVLTQRRYLILCQPIGTRLPIERNENFGTSPFFGQLFGQSRCPRLHHHNGHAGHKEQ